METVIEAFPAKHNISTSNYNYEYFGYLDENIVPLEDEKKYLIDALIRIFNKPVFNKIIDIDITAKSEESYFERNMISGHEISSPLMSPKKIIDIEVIIESIEKGAPSICDEILEL